MVAAAQPQEHQRVRCAAATAMRGAYAPYSRYPVGAAALLENGTLISGANLENASYGLTLCAETSMVAGLPAQRADQHAALPRLRVIAVVNADNELITPCGRCRQVLAEFADEHTVVLTRSGPVPLGQLLPMAFGPADLAAGTTDPATTQTTTTAPRQGKEIP